MEWSLGGGDDVVNLLKQAKHYKCMTATFLYFLSRIRAQADIDQSQTQKEFALHTASGCL